MGFVVIPIILIVVFTIAFLYHRNNTITQGEPGAKKVGLRGMMANRSEYLAAAKLDPRETLGAWGEQHGLSYQEVVDPGPLTAFLRRDENTVFGLVKRKPGPGVVGQIASDPNGLLCHFTFLESKLENASEFVNRKTLGKLTGEKNEAPIEYTVCKIDLNDIGDSIPSFTLRQKAYMASTVEPGEREVSLESSVLHGRGRLVISDSEGPETELRLRTIFDPVFIDWLVAQPGVLDTEFEAGVLVVHGLLFAVQEEALDSYLTWISGFERQLREKARVGAGV